MRNPNVPRIDLRIPPELIERVRQEAARTRRSLNAQLLVLIEAGLRDPADAEMARPKE